ncbi:uroporphyrinogen-III synthase [Actinospica durhamensis]|uniref:uroporphyrinogen-III synthase n=1 Tax=Actinospica durhamensis TaxID=1508375 RepID=UPI0027DBDF27|nr:uroporphyrinogen-III synthase [Actinospica durhamensis]
MTAVRTIADAAAATLVAGPALTPLEKIESALETVSLPGPRPRRAAESLGVGSEPAEGAEGEHAAEAGESERPAHRARVSFVGAGPGDPDLLTLRGAAALAEADMLVLDRHLIERFRPLARPDVLLVEIGSELAAPAVPVAKGVVLPASAFGHPISCPEPVLAAMAEAVASGRHVVRLLDGDPGLFSPLETEAAACARAAVPFEVVPGLARATAVPMFAGIPLSRGSIGDVRLLSAPHPAAGENFTAWSDWHRQLGEAGASASTLVLQGVGDRIEEVAAELLAAGRPGSTPVAVTVDGSLTSQRTVTGTLDKITAALKAERVSCAGAGTVVVVGAVVNQRAELSWYESKPLFGWRVLVPRTKEQAGALSEQLRRYGAVPTEVPTISVEPPRTPQQMERAVKGLVTGRYEWVAFTSVNAVKAVREKFEDYGLDARAFAGIKVAAVGEATAKALKAFGVVPDLVPAGEQSAAGLLAEFPAFDPAFDPIERVFLPRADIATEVLSAGLVELGWEVDDVTAYRTVRAAPPAEAIREAIKGGGFDAVLFTSSSTVRNLVGIAGKPHSATVITCIGPATAATAREHGLRVDVLAPTPSAAALAEALAAFGASRREAQIAAGDPVTRPSERTRARRRRA